MLNFAHLLLLSAPLAAQDPAADPTPAEAAKAISIAAESKDLDEIRTALKAYGQVPGTEVAKAAHALLGQKDPKVQAAGIQALRYQPDASALTYLLKHAKNKKLLSDETVAREYYLALGQKADKKCLKVLADGLRIDKNSRVVEARIVALGRIREKDSIDALMKLLVSGRGRIGNPHIAHIQASLQVLTGEDFGKKEEDWNNWWASTKRGYDVPPLEVIELPRRLEMSWAYTWMTPAEKEKANKKVRGKELVKGKKTKDDA